MDMGQTSCSDNKDIRSNSVMRCCPGVLGRLERVHLVCVRKENEMTDHIKYDWEDMCREHLAIYYKAGQIVKEKEVISFLPRRCRISGKFLWFRRATKLTRKFKPNIIRHDMIERLWVDSKQLTLFHLRGPQRYL